MSMTRRLLILGLLAASLFAPAHPATAQNFPRTGGYLIGGSTTPLTPAHVAPLDVVMLGAYEGWKNSQGLNPSQFAAAAKALNPNFKMFIYTNIESLNNDPPQPADLDLIGTVPWWLYESGTSGTMAPGCCGSAPYSINVTTYSKVYNGQNYPTWRGKRDVGVFVTPFPSVDGLYVDNVYAVPRWNGDFTLSGTTQSKSDPTTQHIYRMGYVAYFNSVRAAGSSAQQMITGNVADWYSYASDLADYQGVLNGGVMESIIGQSYSYESQSWATMMASYTTTMNALAAPKYGIFSVDADSATDYQEARYALGSCLLGDGYFYFHVSNYNDYVTLDEYSVNLGTANVPALVFPGAAAWQKGVYRRDFQNGIALVNPKGNGPQTVTLETSYKHISGTQDPSVNNGQTVTTVTLNDRDGVILLRLTSQSVPDPPTLTVQ